MNTTKERNKVYEKYQGKTIRVKGKVYTIRIANLFDNTIVEFNPKFSTGFYVEPRSDTDYDPNVETSYAMAVDKTKEILAELESAEQTDFNDELGLSDSE